ncbi:TraR/DksA C4-type zinc finger protein [Patescibacteria group bacterium]|nr:TraR/DksA C4-type zinc finger protein [Patescibacteria group bacterium]
MDKKLEKQLKEKLEAEKKRLTNDLGSFARKDPKIKRNWITRFPFLGLNRSHPDENAEEIEEYENLLPVEYVLEIRLKNIEEALEKIEKGTYGKCEACGKEIEIKRLKVISEAKLCLACGKKK